MGRSVVAIDELCQMQMLVMPAFITFLSQFVMKFENLVAMQLHFLMYFTQF